jgi:DNA-binding helix-hairpin-helix protein with protein kinase domain
MPSEPRTVTDDTGVVFTLGSQIGQRGAQGAVYRVEGHPGFAVKLLDRESDLATIELVRRLSLDGINIAAPITLIRNGGNGYLMPLAADMTPLGETYLRPQLEAKATPGWYVDTGSLRRRLAIAANTASSIAALHAKGLAYVDLNPNNVMVSDDLSRSETWLIDSDNLTSRSRPVGQLLGYPGFIAPERIRQGAPASTLADTYSLAIHAFQMLVLRHPLEGIAADDLDASTVWGQTGSDGRRDWGLVDLGELPYVADPHDTSNALNPRKLSGILLGLALSGQIRQIAEQTFGVGRLDPLRRPSAGAWRDVLFGALDNVVSCAANCGWSYYRTRAECPCGEPSSAPMLVTFTGGSIEEPFQSRGTMVIARDTATTVLPRHLWGRYGDVGSAISIHPAGPTTFDIETHGDITFTDQRGKNVSNVHQPEPGDVKRYLLTAPDRPSRVLTFRTVPAL